jgi:hypothetical protein
LFNYLQAFPNISVAAWSPHSTLQIKAKHRPYLGLPSYSLVSQSIFFTFKVFKLRPSSFWAFNFLRMPSSYLYIFYLSLFVLQPFPLFCFFPTCLVSILILFSLSLPILSSSCLFLFINFSFVVLVSTHPLPSFLFISSHYLNLLSLCFPFFV